MRRLLERLGVPGLCFAIGFLFAALRLLAPWPLELLDLKALDLRFLLRGARVPTGMVVIVGIDEPSLARYGRWPWPRARLTELVDRLTAYGARTIAFDAVFDQPDPCGDDAGFAAALRSSGRAVLGEFFEFGGKPSPPASFTEISVRDRGGGLERLEDATGFHGPIASFAAAATATGHVNFLPDRDGMFRRVPLVVRMGDRVAPALAVAALGFQLGKSSLLDLRGPGDTALVIGGERIPIDDAGDLRIDFLGPPGTVPNVSALAVLEQRASRLTLDDKLVLIAPTAVGFDSRPTPFSGSAPGVEIHASVIDNLIVGRGLVRPPGFVPLEALFTFALGAATGLLIRWRALPGAIGALSLYLIYLSATQIAFTLYGTVATVVYPYASVALATLGGLLYQYFFEARARRARERALSHYVGSQVAEMLATEPDRLRLGGVGRDITILFTDIRGFSNISEHLPPQDLADLLTEHLGAQTDVVFRHKGFLDKYIGDAIMAFWNAPNDVPDHARHACLAALEIVAIMPELQARWRQRGWPLIEIGVGIDTGHAVVGNFGSSVSERFNYTAISDHVNTASRLEGLNKVYGSRILISEETREIVGEEFVCRELDCVRVKGKKKPVTVYELLCLRADDRGGRAAHLAGAFAQAFMHYRGRRFAEAIRVFEDLRDLDPDDPAVVHFLERCRILEGNPPQGEWDGVYEALTK